MTKKLLTPSMVLIRSLMREIEVETGITADEIMGTNRRADVSFARHRIIHKLHDLGYHNFGISIRLNLDHSSIHHALKRDMTAPPLRYIARVKRWGTERDAKPEPPPPFRPTSLSGGW